MYSESFYRNHHQTLAGKYLEQAQEVRPLFDFHYREDTSWQERANWLQYSKSLRADQQAVCTALSIYNAHIGNSPRAMEHIQALASQQAYVVIGGQQAGLFSGPLYTIYKAISIIRLAEETSHKLGHPVIPVFWMAGEDHDFDEVNHVNTLEGYLQIHKLKVDRPHHNRSSVSQIILSEAQWESLLQQINHLLADSPHKNTLIRSLQDTLGRQAMSLTEGFARLMARWFASYGLVLVDADDSRLRSLESPMWQRLIRENDLLCDALLQGKQDCEKLGYTVQTEYDERHAHLFITEHAQRKLVMRHGQGFSDKHATSQWTVAQLLDIAQSNPSRLSNGVMTRPLMQDYVFPVLATVLGHAEIAYWALTKRAFDVMQMRMPIIVPRIELTLLEPPVRKLLNRYQWSVQDVLTGTVEWQDIRGSEESLPLVQHVDDIEQHMAQHYAQLLEQLATYDQQLVNVGQHNLMHIQRQLAYLRHKIVQAERDKEDSAYRQRACIEQSLLPFAKPQERVYNILVYMNRYGESWIHELVRTVQIMDGKHYIYEFIGGTR